MVVSTGDPAATRAENFASPVVLDREYALRQVLGAGGTPMAALLDARGRVAAPIAAGEDEVFSRLEPRR